MKLLSGNMGITATVPKIIIKEYGSRKLENLTGYLDESKTTAKWIANSKKHIILIKASNFKLVAGKGESEMEAEFGDSVKQLADYGGFSNPTTQEIIDFFNF